jgi:predicted esterase
MATSMGRLSARPGAPAATAPPAPPAAPAPPTGSGGEREHVAALHVPSTPVERVVVLLHGAGGNAGQALDLLRPYADGYGLLLVATTSAGPTWDVILGGYGTDVERLDRTLATVFSDHDVGSDSVAIGGFSDGASYALSLGIANGDLFSAVLAFSPGFAAPAVRHGRPRIFVSHGRADTVLPVERCGRRLSRVLANSGYAVSYEEFAGGHTVPDDIRVSALDWLTRRG